MDFRAAATSWWMAATPSGRRVSCPCFTARCTPKVSPGCWRGWRLPSAADRVRGQGAWLEELRQALSILDFERPVWTLPPQARVCQLGFRPWVQRSPLLHPGCGRWGRWEPGRMVTAPSAECEATGSDAELCVSHVRLKTRIVHMVTTVPKRREEPLEQRPTMPGGLHGGCHWKCRSLDSLKNPGCRLVLPPHPQPPHPGVETPGLVISVGPQTGECKSKQGNSKFLGDFPGFTS